MKYVKIKGSKKLTKYVKPMLAVLTERAAFDDAKWIFEIKWDGYRAIAEINDGELSLYSRNGITFNLAYPKIAAALGKIKANCVIDGEIVVFDETGKPSFQKMQNYTSNSSSPIQYFAFDCLSINGKDITKLPLLERKAQLKKIIPKTGLVMYCDHHEGKGIEFYRQVEKLNLEGMIAKRSDSKYEEGKRSNNWLKIKNINDREVVIVGYTQPQGSRAYFGSLLIADYEGKKLKSLGNVGTGFTDKILKDLFALLSREKRKTSPLDIPIKDSPGVTWVNPVYRCKITFTEMTEDGNARHPVYQGLI